MSDIKDTADDVLGGGKKKISLTQDELQALISKAISESQAQTQTAVLKELTNAILESRKPYISPETIANEEAFKKSSRELAERIQRARKAAMENCQHLQGSHELSEATSPQGLTSIIQHYTDVGALIGLCTNCGRFFYPGDSDYVFWMRKKSGNKASAAGRRMFVDPIKAMEAGKPTQ